MKNTILFEKLHENSEKEKYSKTLFKKWKIIKNEILLYKILILKEIKKLQN